jgi:hypothetical protein
MGTPQVQRLLVVIGGGVLVVAIAILAAVLFMARDKTPQEPPPASAGGLVVQTGQVNDGKLDPKKSLRCFVNGQFEGVETLADCARKNGVATDALGVGIDQTGALAAANGSGAASLAPLPPAASGTPPDAAPPDTVVTAPAPKAPVGDCLRYAGSVPRKIGTAMSLSACVQAIFSGPCTQAGETSYGRWGDNALRMEAHRVEMSDDNLNYRLLVEQGDNCVIPQF